MVGHRAVVVGLLIVMLAVCVAGLWPEPELRPLVATTTAPASAQFDDDTTKLERSLVADPEARSEEVREPRKERRDAIAELIRDLAHDDVRGNAGAALWRLARNAEAAGQLHRALDSADLQQRQLAAIALTRLGQSTTTRFAEVLVESMHDSVERLVRQTGTYSSAINATRHLYRHPTNARPSLRKALWTGDPQQRFLAAFLLGSDGSIADMQMIVRELVDNLADNHTSGDAMMAAHSFYRLGRRVVPHLLAWRPHVDRQARQLIDLIVLDLESPPQDRAELTARKHLHSVTRIYHDPVLEFDIGRSRIATR